MLSIILEYYKNRLIKFKLITWLTFLAIFMKLTILYFYFFFLRILEDNIAVIFYLKLNNCIRKSLSNHL